MANLSVAFPDLSPASGTSEDLAVRRPAEPEDDAPSSSTFEGAPKPAEVFAAVAAEKARLRVWAEAIRSSELGGSFLVLRPAPDWPQTDYPSAAAAYSELSKVVEQL
jgi:hypothetical protein